jgi:hypothetical protein
VTYSITVSFAEVIWTKPEAALVLLERLKSSNARTIRNIMARFDQRTQD